MCVQRKVFTIIFAKIFKCLYFFPNDLGFRSAMEKQWVEVYRVRRPMCCKTATTFTFFDEHEIVECPALIDRFTELTLCNPRKHYTVPMPYGGVFCSHSMKHGVWFMKFY